MEPRVPQKRRVRLIYELGASDTSKYAATPRTITRRIVTRARCGVSHPHLGALLQRLAIADGNPASLHRDQARVLEFLHRARHRLAARADHLRNGLVGKRLVDCVAPGLVGEIQQQPRDPTRDVQKHESADLHVGPPQAPGQLGQQRPGDGGVRFYPSTEVLPPEDEQLRVVHRDHVRRTGLIVDQRQFAEVRARLEHAQDHFAPVLPDQDDLDASRAQDEQRVAGVVLEEDDAPLRVGALAGEVSELLDLVTLEPAEQRHGGEEIGGLGDQFCRHGNLFGALWLTLRGPEGGVKRATYCRLVFYGLGSVYFAAVSEPVLIARQAHSEDRHPSRVRHRGREVRVRQHLRDALHDRRHPYGRLRRVPPVLHGQAAPRRYRRPRGAVPSEVPDEAGRRQGELAPEPPRPAARGTRAGGGGRAAAFQPGHLRRLPEERRTGSGAPTPPAGDRAGGRTREVRERARRGTRARF